MIAPAVSEAVQESEIRAVASPDLRLEDIPAGPNTKLTIERLGQIALFGINLPCIQNRIDPETFEKLAEGYYKYDHDPPAAWRDSIWPRENFSRGIDVEGFKPLAGTGKPWIARTGTIDPLAKRGPHSPSL
ncbi:hypothetical protein [Tunturiibacter gelidiferens]|uniref:hypothetical protein n=1 Tax=Tunturiibacter gelidiferens TaxID=3069689 RepID=UPI003D9AC787